MRKLLLNNGGRNFLNDDLEVLQGDVYRVLEGLLKGLGPVIVEGCEFTLVSGTVYNMSAGLVYLDGKYLELDSVTGLDLAADQYIQQAAVNNYDNRLYENGSNQNSLVERKAEIATSQPTAPAESITIDKDFLPVNIWAQVGGKIGEIRMTDEVASFDSGVGKGKWQGWAVCNGSNGTPDLQGKFVVGQDTGDSAFNVISETGGAKTVTLTESQIPAHSHKLVADVTNSDTDLSAGGQIAKIGSVNNNDGDYRLADTATAATLGNSSSVGSGSSHENLPPYYTLVYVKKIS